MKFEIKKVLSMSQLTIDRIYKNAFSALSRVSLYMQREAPLAAEQRDPSVQPSATDDGDHPQSTTFLAGSPAGETWGFGNFLSFPQVPPCSDESDEMWSIG